MADWRDRAVAFIDRRWKLVVLLVWIVFCALFLFNYRADILLFNLSDSDDNMRLMQVRDLLNGQPWYDLRQYRMNPPYGANIHWSHLVDLPIAGLILGLGTFLDASHAERLAVAIAPLIPLLLLLFSLTLTARRLIGRKAYPLVFLALYFSSVNNELFMPERIDHHGWQLALLALSVSAIADPKRVRGGLTLGISTALSLAIGLEMLIYVALAAVATVLFWVNEPEERERLGAYAVSLGGGTALAFLVFASNDNWNAVCDALSPVWLSDALIGSALMLALAWISPIGRKRRLGLAFGAGIIVIGFHVVTWPHCLQRLEGVSPEVERLWLRQVREAWPLDRFNWRIVALVSTMSVVGLIGWSLLAWSRRKDREQLRRVLGAALPALTACLLLFWQARTAPAAEMLGIVGCAAFIWLLVPIAWCAKSDVVGVAGALLVTIVGAGAAVPIALSIPPAETPTESDIVTANADSACPSLWAMQDVGRQPKGMVMTLVDFAPRLIIVTDHDAVAGPYHRNGRQIVDVMNFWRGSETQARAIAGKYHANYVLSCPHSSATSAFDVEAPDGFYEQLRRGEVPKWLAPVELAEGSPWKMWRIVG